MWGPAIGLARSAPSHPAPRRIFINNPPTSRTCLESTPGWRRAAFAPITVRGRGQDVRSSRPRTLGSPSFIGSTGPPDPVPKDNRVGPRRSAHQLGSTHGARATPIPPASPPWKPPRPRPPPSPVPSGRLSPARSFLAPTREPASRHPPPSPTRSFARRAYLDPGTRDPRLLQAFISDPNPANPRSSRRCWPDFEVRRALDLFWNYGSARGWRHVFSNRGPQDHHYWRSPLTSKPFTTVRPQAAHPHFVDPKGSSRRQLAADNAAVPGDASSQNTLAVFLGSTEGNSSTKLLTSGSLKAPISLAAYFRRNPCCSSTR